ncbi:MAG: lamin tail domain-containing protein [Deltaproteobacteria bacterium]|nr:lamin tail domain-containing protein [Deltaproteobacteria bacterium]
MTDLGGTDRGAPDTSPADIGGQDQRLPDSAVPDVAGDAAADAGSDSGYDAGFDAGLDAGLDAGRDAAWDGGLDAAQDAAADAGVDGAVVDGASPDSTADAGAAADALASDRAVIDAARPDGGYCVSSGQCEDGLNCTSHSCIPGDPQADERGCVTIANDAVCQDAFSCTVNRCAPLEPGADYLTGCLRTSDDVRCPSDNRSCTIERCDPAAGGADPATGCITIQNHASCGDDGFSCTAVTCDPDLPGADSVTGCAHVPSDPACDDGIDCTRDTCAPTDPNATALNGCVRIGCACQTRTDISAGGTFSASTAGGIDQIKPPTGCTTSSAAPEVLFLLTVSQMSYVILDASGSSFDTVMYVLRDCAVPAIACNDNGGTANGARIAQLLGAGTYYVVVDGVAAASGSVSLGVTIAPSGVAPSPGQLVITEFLPDSVAVADGNGEWVEIYSTALADVDINGCTLRDDGVERHVIDAGGPLLVHPGSYIVLGRDGNTSTNGGVTVDYVYSDFFLGNDDDEIVLECGGVLIDRVAYDGGPLFPDPSGASLQFDPDVFAAPNPETSNDLGSSWCETHSSVLIRTGGDKGSPGRANPTCTRHNDYCANAQHIELVDGAGSAQGDTTKAYNDFETTLYYCLNFNYPYGKDLFYSFDATAGNIYEVTVDPASGYNPIVYIFEQCSNAYSTCIDGMGAYSAGTGGNETARFIARTSGRRRVGVDATSESSSSYYGPFELRIRSRPYVYLGAALPGQPVSVLGATITTAGTSLDYLFDVEKNTVVYMYVDGNGGNLDPALTLWSSAVRVISTVDATGEGKGELIREVESSTTSRIFRVADASDGGGPTYTFDLVIYAVPMWSRIPGSGTPVAIPDNNSAGVSSSAEMPPGTIRDLNVEVNIEHSYTGNLVVTLRSSAASDVLLHNRTGSSNDDIETIYDYSRQPDQGNGAMNVFHGLAGGGTWTLNVADLASSYTGTFSSWALLVDGISTADYCGLLGPATLSVRSGERSASIEGWISEAGKTDVSVGGPAAGITAEVGYGPAGTTPSSTGWYFFPASFIREDSPTGGDDYDVYGAHVLTAAAGSYDYAIRFMVDGIGYLYCDLDSSGGSSDDYQAVNAGHLTVVE